MKILRNEYPRPDFRRDCDSWQSLNGEWDFQSAPSPAGKDFCPDKESYCEKITVPFVPESRLSGIGRSDFMGWVSYRKSFLLQKHRSNDRILLHIGAADWESRVWVNGKPAGGHRGGYTPAQYDISPLVTEGENTIAISVSDHTRNSRQPSGKQAGSLLPRGCFYTRCTGIWQSVWLEFVPEKYISSVKIIPDVKNGMAHFSVDLCGDGTLNCEISFDGSPVCKVSALSCNSHAVFSAPIPDAHLWDIGQGNLYDVLLTFGEDRAKTYFGMRSIETDGKRLLLNSRPVFMRLVLDQGYYPDGIYTASDAADFHRDIAAAMSAGFNGARLHMKIFEPGFLYEADRAGYLLWGEYPNWGLDVASDAAAGALIPEWTSEIQRDINHPSIIGWCPLNEAFPGTNGEFFRELYRITKQLDPSRPVIDTSGYVHSGVGDIYDVHDYEQDPAVFRSHYAGLCGDGEEIYENRFDQNAGYDGKMPYFVSEFGGAFFDCDALHESSGQESGGAWGYGAPPKNVEQFEARFAALCGALLDNPHICGFCYTQFTDVEQEMNGIFTYDRREKFNTRVLKEAISRPATIEKA